MDVYTLTLFMKLRNETMMNDWTAYLCKHTDTHTLIHNKKNKKKTSLHRHTCHTHMQTHCTNTSCFETSLVSQESEWHFQSNQRSAQAQDQSRETRDQSFLLTFNLLYSFTLSSGSFCSILRNIQHINVMKCDQNTREEMSFYHFNSVLVHDRFSSVAHST